VPAGGSIAGCFAAVAGPRDPRGARHGLPCVLAVMAMLHGKTRLNAITAGPPAFPVSGPVLRPRLACDGK
jgi:hypothetical protein